MNYKELINANKEKFNNEDTLINFLDNYTDKDESDTKDQEDNIAEYVDGLVPIYYYDIVKEWQENSEAREMTVEALGSYDGMTDIYKMMSSDLYFYYEQQLREDYDALIDLLDDQEEEVNQEEETK